ncbi:MAG: hypothetical protein P9L88_07775 [Candidatus Tantalella remota]|nr:hypothetical protein [Candidatus Tantalella remota]
MMIKERLIASLNELIYVEEGMVTLFTHFSQALVDETEGLDEAKRKDIKKLLSVLYRDSSRHKEAVENMISQVEAGGKNEY